jgi:hypothetical protein
MLLDLRKPTCMPPTPPTHTWMSLCCCVCCCSLSVHAEPFGSPPAPVPLDLLDLPQGLTHLELRNIDVITAPADLAAAAAAAAGAPAVDLAGAGAPAAAAADATGAPPTARTASGVSDRVNMHTIPAGVWVPAAAVPSVDSSISGSSISVSSVSCRVSTDCGGGGGSSSSGSGSRRSSDTGGGHHGVLQRLESFKLESCRLRGPQLQVGLVSFLFHA